jgi:hypothetical protein
MKNRPGRENALAGLYDISEQSGGDVIPLHMRGGSR